MTPPRSKLFEAAVRAAAEAIEDCEYNPKYVARAILTAALPPDPAPETLSAMWRAYLTAEAEEEMLDAYAAIRASLLPEEEPS